MDLRIRLVDGAISPPSAFKESRTRTIRGGSLSRFFNRARYRARPRPRSLKLAGEKGAEDENTSTIWRGDAAFRIRNYR